MASTHIRMDADATDVHEVDESQKLEALKNLQSPQPAANDTSETPSFITSVPATVIDVTSTAVNSTTSTAQWVLGGLLGFFQPSVESKEGTPEEEANWHEAGDVSAGTLDYSSWKTPQPKKTVFAVEVPEPESPGTPFSTTVDSPEKSKAKSIVQVNSEESPHPANRRASEGEEGINWSEVQTPAPKKSDE